MSESGCDAINLEGGAAMADRMKGIVDAGIPAIGHLGLTPQSVSALGGFRLQGKSALLAKKIVDDAKALEEAGAFCILLELVPDRLCKLIMERAENCIIMSLGAGPDAHGQLLIYHDMFGLYPKFKPKMAKVYGNAGEVILNGLKGYHDEVIGGQFPMQENVMLPLIYSGVRKAQRKVLAEQTLNDVGLSDRMHHRPNELSGGQRQRVAIARALVNKPALLLADEPTGNLDSKISEEIMQLFAEIHRKGNTLVMVTHEPDIARHAHRIIRLKDGEVESDEMNPDPIY